MELEIMYCKICGGTLTKKGDGEYICDYNPTHVFREKSITEQREQMLSLFGEALYKQKEEQVANIRSNLYEAVHEEFTDSKKVIGYCRELKKLMPEDFQANFYETANGKNLRNINKILDGIDVDKQRYHIDDMVEFMLKSLESRNVSSLKNLIDRAYKDEKYTEYITQVEDEAEKLDNGIYEPSLPRDVFIAYSSIDTEKVNEIVEFLESENISCFVSLRNMRHGKGAVEDYKTLLETAMHNCKCVVFISSENSRTLSCDALKIELPYIKECEPEMGRIEYVIETYGKKTGQAAKTILEDFFKGLEYCRTKEDLISRLLKYVAWTKGKRKEQSEKYCLACGAKNPVWAEVCTKKGCGSEEFTESYEKYLESKKEKELKREREQLQKKQEEELARRQRELEEKLKQQQEEKIAAGRAELEAQKKELLRKQKEFEEQLRKKLEAEYSAKLTEKAEPPKPAESDYPTLENYDKAKFKIEGTVLNKYLLEDKKGEVKIPQGVTKIKEKAFWCCSGLTSITIPNSVTTIGDCAFQYCSGLTEITIPNGVTTIGESAFYSCSGLTSITIPNSVTAIGKSAFEGCSGLESITVSEGNEVYYSKNNCIIEKESKKLILGCKNSVIPSDGSVTSIGNEAFRGCCGLTGITIPNSVNSIGYYAFSYCSELKSIIFSSNINLIDEFAFKDCSNLTSLTIPNSVTAIGDCAFEGCSGLENITVSEGNEVYYSKNNCIIEKESKTLILGCKNSVIPSDGSVTAIGYCAFDGCSGLTSIAIPNSVTSIEWYAFSGCASLTSIRVPNGLTEIGEGVFQDCNGLTSITIPNSVTAIGDCAFEDCNGLTSITIPNSVTTIGDHAFSCSGLTSLLIPDSVTRIGDCAFEGCDELVSIMISKGVTKIDTSMFGACSELESIAVSEGNEVYFSKNNCIIEKESKTLILGCKNSVIPSDGSVTAIGECAFYDCVGLTSITIPNSVITIDDGAFEECSELKNVTMPEGLKPFIDSAFGEEKEHINFIFTSGYPTLENYDKTEFKIEDTVLKEYQLKYKKGDAKIPQGITEIEGKAFLNCHGLTSITIPYGVTKIGDDAFSGCNRLESITIPNSVTTIGNGAFSYCSGLTSITIPDSVTTMGSGFYSSPFYGCSGLESLTVSEGNEAYYSMNNCIIEKKSKALIFGCKNSIIPDDGRVTAIGMCAFEGCSGLTSITIPYGVTKIGDDAFCGCSRLESITIPNSVTTIGSSAFKGCSGLTSITIPNGVTTIGSSAFYGCSGLTSITISEEVESYADGMIYRCFLHEIGYDAFCGCSGLKSITIPYSVTTIGSCAFYGCSGLTSVTMPSRLKQRIKNAFGEKKKHIKFTFTK